MKEMIKKVLNQYTERECEGISDVLNQWNNNKAGLKEFLGGNLTIEKKISLNKTENEIIDEVHNFIHEYKDVITEKVYKILKHFLHVEDIILNKCELDSCFIDLPNYKPGQKLSGVLRELIPEELNFIELKGKQKSRREYFDIVYSRLLQSFKTDGILVVSIHPLDYLTMSLNRSNWQSCHRPDGEYRAGMMSYLADSVSAIAYCHSGKEVEYDYGFKWNSKNWRQMVYIDLENKGAVFSRQYPRQDDLVAKEVREMIGEQFTKIYGLQKKWKVCHNENEIQDDIEDCYNHLHYSDVRNDFPCSRIKMNSESKLHIVVGKTPICPVCGVDDLCNNDELMCDNCKDGVTCSHCGGRVEEHYVEWYGDSPYCRECFNELFAFCSHCDEIHSRDNLVMVYDDNYVCPDCLDRYYIQCEECGEYHRGRDITGVADGKDVCENCIEKYYIQCEQCNEYFKENDLIDGYCTHCYEERKEEIAC
jgi:hypothetical protein